MQTSSDSNYSASQATASLEHSHSSSMFAKLIESSTWIALIFCFAILLWNPCDSGASVAAGDTIYAIALSLGTFGLVALWIWVSVQGNQWASTRLLWLFLSMVVLWHAMATGWTVGKSNTKFAIHGFWQSTAFWCLLFCVAWMSRTSIGAARLLRWWWVLAAFVILYGFWEYGVLQPKFRAELATDRAGLLERQGIEPDSSMAILITNRIESTEIRSLFALANSYAGFLVAIWPVLLGWGITVLMRRGDKETSSGDSRKGANTEWALVLLCIAATALALLLTKSRSAWVAAAVGVGLTLLFDPQLRRDGYGWYRKHFGLTVGALVLLAAIFGTVYAMDPLIFQEAGKSLAYRMNYWEGAWTLIQESPLLGYGSLNFQPTYLRVKRSIAAETPADPHNFLLEIAHSGGWGLLGLTLFFIAAVAWFAWRSNKRSSEVRTIETVSGGAWVARSSYAAMVLSALSVLVFAFLTVGDDELIGTSLALVGACAFGIWLLRNPSAGESVLTIVRDKPVLFYIAWIVSLVHLLASGGWMLPGTMAGPILSLGLFIGSIGRGSRSLSGLSATTAIPEPKIPEPKAPVPERMQFLPVLIAAGLIGFWGWSMWLPSTRANYVANQLITSKDPPSIDTFSSWMQAAPYDPDLARLGMEYCASMFETPMDAAARERWLHLFQQTRTQFLDRDPNHALAFSEAAKQSLRIGASIANPAEGQSDSFRELRGSGRRMQTDSVEFFRQAALNAQASAEMQLQGAMAAALVGNWKVSEKLLEKAQGIDELTSHSDRKIQATRIWVPRKMLAGFEKSAISANRLVVEGNSDWKAWKEQVQRSESVPGEPVARLLRSLQQKPVEKPVEKPAPAEAPQGAESSAP